MVWGFYKSIYILSLLEKHIIGQISLKSIRDTVIKKINLELPPIDIKNPA